MLLIGTANEWGAGIRIGQASSRNQILNNSITNTGRGGILCDNGSTDLVIRANTITGSGKTAEGLGLEVWGGCDRSLIEDNKIDHWLSVDASNNLAVRRNTISDTTGTTKWAGIELVDAHDDIFTDNTVNGGAKIGISESGPGAKERIFFGRNTIKSATIFGVQIQGEINGATRQYFYKNTISNTTRASTDYGPQGHGFRFNGNANHIVLHSNTIDSNAGYGLQITDANVNNLRVINNNIISNGDVAVDGSAPNSIFAGNKVRQNRKDNALANTAGLTIPTGSLGPDRNAIPGEEIHFTVNTKSMGAIKNVLWDFGEGLPVSQSFDTSTRTACADHTFTNPGTYQVTVIAWDATGEAAMAQSSIVVTTHLPEPRSAIPAALMIVAMGMIGVGWKHTRADTRRDLTRPHQF